MEYFSSDNERITPLKRRSLHGLCSLIKVRAFLPLKAMPNDNKCCCGKKLSKMKILHRFKEEKKQSKKMHDNNM